MCCGVVIVGATALFQLFEDHRVAREPHRGWKPEVRAGLPVRGHPWGHQALHLLTPLAIVILGAEGRTMPVNRRKGPVGAGQRASPRWRGRSLKATHIRELGTREPPRLFRPLDPQSDSGRLAHATDPGTAGIGGAKT